MSIETEPYRVRERECVSLDKRPTHVQPLYEDKRDYRRILAQHVESLSEFQRRHYASNSFSLLLIFQAMDAAGKDGAISHVMSGVNPQGCQVYSFKHPSASELQHDFLWRAAALLPERGRIGIFNRSYYEEVLIVRVHPELLRAEGVPEGAKNGNLWKRRFDSIVAFERHLSCNGTRIVKFFLHLSREEQRRRFLSRIDEPEKNWKFSLADVAERSHWNDYMSAYEKCLSATTSSKAPWYVIPADDKRNARLLISQVVLDTLADLHPSYPETTPERKRELASIREILERDEN